MVRFVVRIIRIGVSRERWRFLTPDWRTVRSGVRICSPAPTKRENALPNHVMTLPVHRFDFAPPGIITKPLSFARFAVRALGLIALLLIAIVDALLVWLMTKPTGSRLAQARANWFHRWSRFACYVLGLRLNRHGFAPVSGLIVANHTSLLDAVLLAAVRPCVFVAGDEVRRQSIAGFIGRLAGTYFVDRSQRRDVARMNFMIERALRRRMLVVIFPECGGAGSGSPRAFTSALFQPATDLGCSVTAAGISYWSRGHRSMPLFAHEPRLLGQIARVLMHCRASATVAFGKPTFRPGNRKSLARQLRGEVLDLKLCSGHAGR
jgi:1-acyl-sn-glycerol-3-phosphate acyltransferase